MIHMFPSDELYPAFNFFLTTRAQWINSVCHFDLCNVPEEERAAFLLWADEELDKLFQELIH